MPRSSRVVASLPARTAPVPAPQTPAMVRTGRLPNMLQNLLVRLGDLGSKPEARGQAPAVRRYRDDDFNYLEVALPELEGVEADISIHEGCIYVRVLR